MKLCQTNLRLEDITRQITIFNLILKYFIDCNHLLLFIIFNKTFPNLKNKTKIKCRLYSELKRLKKIYYNGAHYDIHV